MPKTTQRVVGPAGSHIVETTGVDTAVFARHLDLAPLGARHRGLVRCIFHQDRTASLSVDLDAGIFNCFGCGASGGVIDFTFRVGEKPTGARPHRPPPTVHEIALQMAKRQPWARGTTPTKYEMADHLYVAQRVQRTAGDTEAGWDALARAAWLTSEAEAVLAELDDEERRR